MINARSIATLGIGFGTLAIATIGFIANVQPQLIIDPFVGMGWEQKRNKIMHDDDLVIKIVLQVALKVL